MTSSECVCQICAVRDSGLQFKELGIAAVCSHNHREVVTLSDTRISAFHSAKHLLPVLFVRSAVSRLTDSVFNQGSSVGRIAGRVPLAEVLNRSCK